MMKSFFKKLSLVMALAMVVSMMAPAASAFAADLIIAEQEEKKADAKEEYSVEVGKEVDFKFYGALAGWQDLYKWESSDETVAKPLVNEEGKQDGKFEALKDGEVEITLTIGEQKATVKLVVGKGEVKEDKSFEVKQLTANKLQLTFADKAYATKDVTVNKVVTTADGSTKAIVWVLNSNKTAAKDNVVTIEPWVAFGTATYEITANGETVTFNTAVGDPAVADLQYKEPYTFAEAGKAAAKTLTVTDANGVEVSPTAYTAYYELVAAEPSGYAYVDGSNGDLYFYADNVAAAVKVTIQYYVGTELKKFDYVTEVVTQKKPVVTIIPVLDSTAVVAGNADLDKTVWGSSEVKIGDGTYKVVGLIKDSADKSFAINNGSKGTKDWNKEVVSGYKFTFESTDTSKVLVNAENGELVGVNVGTAYVLVTMWKVETGKSDVNMGIVAAVPVTVQAKKAASYVTLDKTMAVLLTTGDYKTVTVTPKTYNQYNEEYKDVNGNKDTIASVSTTFNNVTHNATIADDKLSFTLDAADANAKLNAGNIKSTQFTYTVKMASGKTTTFTLTLKTVPGAQNEVYKLNVSGAEVKFDDLTKKVSISVVSEVLGEKFEDEVFYYGKVDASVAKPNDIYVVVRDKDNTVVTPATTGALTAKFETAAVTKNASGEAITTLKTGVYTVELYKVIAVQNGVVLDTRIDSASYAVTNNLPTAATDVKANLDIILAVGADNKVVLTKDAVTFKVNNETCDGLTGGNFTIGAVDAVKVSDDMAFVYGFKVQYKIGNGYVEINVPVNQTFKLK